MEYLSPIVIEGSFTSGSTYTPTAFSSVYYLPERLFLYSIVGGYSSENHYCVFYIKYGYGCSVWSAEFDLGHLSMLGWDFSKAYVFQIFH